MSDGAHAPMSVASLMMAKCGCRPGTEENGWQEVRSQACIDAEMDSWRRMLDRAERAGLIRRSVLDA